MPIIHLIGEPITDKVQLATIEALWKTKFNSRSGNKYEDQQNEQEVLKTICDAFKIPAEIRKFPAGIPWRFTDIHRLIEASRNSIRIAEKNLNVNTEVLWGKRKQRSLVVGYSGTNQVRIKLIDAPAVKYQLRTVSPFDLEPSKIALIVETQKKVEAVFKLLSVTNFGDLSLAYAKCDQELMGSAKWDDEDPTLITNQVRQALEKIDPGDLDDDDQVWWQEIMWFWYHHAISCAIWKKKDKARARRYADKAREIQGPLGHPNRITELLRLLIYDDLDAARSMVADLKTEAETAEATLRLYERVEFRG